MIRTQRKRPLRRRAIKLAANLLGSKWSHAHTWTPHLRLTRGEETESGAILYRGKAIADLHSADILADRAEGREIYIIGSGPSVAHCDLRRLTPLSCILLNGAAIEIGRAIGEPLAIAIEDERFIWRHFDLLSAKIEPGTICLLSVAAIRAICELNAHWLSRMRIVLIDDIRKPYRMPRCSYDELKGQPELLINAKGTAGFSRNPRRGVFQGGSVAISALQFAMYARPQVIGLIGIDILNADEPRFYEQKDAMAPSGLKSAATRIFEHLELAVGEAKMQGIQLHNYAEHSILASCGVPYDPSLTKSSF